MGERLANGKKNIRNNKINQINTQRLLSNHTHIQRLRFVVTEIEIKQKRKIECVVPMGLCICRKHTQRRPIAQKQIENDYCTLWFLTAQKWNEKKESIATSIRLKEKLKLSPWIGSDVKVLFWL